MPTKISKIKLILFIILIFICSHHIVKGEAPLEIDNPRFSEKGLDDKVYEIKAEKGFKSADDLRLITIEGKYRRNDGTWMYLKADSGNFSQLNKTIVLHDNISFYNENNESFTSDYAKFDMKTDTIEFENYVEHESNMGKISADYSIINNQNKITYIGNVKTNLITKQ